MAVIARSGRSNVEYVIDPNELPLNWTPNQGHGKTLEFDRKAISEPGRPSANSAPSTKRPMKGSKRTVVFGSIVRETPGATVTWFVTTYTVSARPQVVSTVMYPETYVVADARGLTPTSPAKEIRMIARTVSALCVRGFHRAADMASNSPDNGGKSVASSLPLSLY